MSYLWCVNNQLKKIKMKKLIIIALALTSMTSCMVLTPKTRIIEYGISQECWTFKDSLTVKTFIYLDFKVDTTITDRVLPSQLDSLSKIRRRQANLIINICNE